jgi:hypothetical protein
MSVACTRWRSVSANDHSSSILTSTEPAGSAAARSIAASQARSTVVHAYRRPAGLSARRSLRPGKRRSSSCSTNGVTSTCRCQPRQGRGDDVPLRTRSLDVSTWDAFVELVERNNGIYGGCWCIVHHPEYERRVSEPRALKQQLVNEGRAQAALVFDEAGVAQGWCQYGKRDELLLKHLRGYELEPPPKRPGGSPAGFPDHPPFSTASPRAHAPPQPPLEHELIPPPAAHPAV